MKWVKSVFAVVLVFLVLLTLNSIPVETTTESMVDTVIFPQDQVVEINITIDESDYHDMINNAIAKESVTADITYNEYTFKDVSMRTKGNSSLRDVAKSESDRYSYKIDFNEYLNDQTFFGITKINLNNLYSDPSMMAEYLGYDMLRTLGADVPRTSYASVSINGEYSGLYLVVEQVNDYFLTEHFGESSGELYKPDMGIGSDLKYIAENGTDYTGMFPENMDSSDNTDIAALITHIEEGGDLDVVLNVDSFLKYLAVSTMTVHVDSYQGGMYHNYYLYNNNGIFEWITWDLNMIFNGFPGSGLTDLEATEFLIDEPVSGVMDNYPLIQAVLQNEEYREKYHDYLEILTSEYFSLGFITEKITGTYNLIKEYVKNDPTSFYTYDEFLDGLFQEGGEQFSLMSFISARAANVTLQINGDITSTNNGEGNSGSAQNGDIRRRPGIGPEDPGNAQQRPAPQELGNRQQEDRPGAMGQNQSTNSVQVAVEAESSLSQILMLFTVAFMMIGAIIIFAKKF
ncbi:MAG: CotH kinase family protein [Bacteroidetes bacterium]|nr:CotH kinase family protein [Bacteroidota bacterium]